MPRETTQSRWTGMPRETRVTERRALLLDTAFDVLGTAGTSGTSVRGVCEAARLNPRYFYESFDGLDELLVAVFDRTAAEAIAATLAALTDADDGLPAQARAGLDALLRHVTEDERRARVLFIEGVGNEALNRRRLDTMAGIVDLLMQTQNREGVSVDQPVVRIAAHAVAGGMAELLLAWVQGRLDVPLEVLVEDAAELFVATGAAAETIARSRTRTR